MSKIRKINVSEFDGNQYSIFPAGTLWVDLQNRLRVSDGITEGGISLAVDPTVIYPTAGDGTAGIIFPNDPGGGSGDAATIKWYPVSGEQMRLHIDVQNDNDDEVLIEASGPIKIKSGQDLWSFADNTITLPDTTAVSAGFVSGGTDNHTAGIATYSSWNQVYAQDSSVGIQTSADGATYYTWGFGTDGNVLFPDAKRINLGSANTWIGWNDTDTNYLELRSGTPASNVSYSVTDQHNNYWEAFTEVDRDGESDSWAWLQTSWLSGNTQQPQFFIENYRDNTAYRWTFDHNGHITFPNSTVQQTAWAGGRVVDVPGSSTGASGDLAGDIAFGTGYFYYCTANYSGTVYNIDSITSSMIARSYLIMYDSNSGFTSNDLSGYTVSGPGGYTGTVSGPSQDQGAGQWYIPVTPDVTQEMGTYTFTSAADIWKRIQWSGDTW